MQQRQTKMWFWAYIFSSINCWKHKDTMTTEHLPNVDIYCDQQHGKTRETARIPLKDECCTLHGKRKISLQQVFTVTRPTLLQFHVEFARSVYTSDHLCYVRTPINLAFICRTITLLHTHKIDATDTLVMHRFFFKNIHSNSCEGWEACFSWCAAWKPQLRPRFPHLFVQLEAHSSCP